MAFESRPPAFTNLTLRDVSLRFHEWFLAHRVQLLRWWVVLILVIDTALALLVSASLLSFFLQTGRYEQLAVGLAQSTRPAPVVSEQRVVELSVVRTDGLTHDGASDLVALVENPNADWIARLTFRFQLGSDETASSSATVAPGESRYLTVLGQSIAGIGQPTLEILATDWTRVTDRNRLENTSFRVENVVYEPAAVAPNTGRTFARVTADVVNASLYGYWVVDVPVVVVQDGRPIAVQLLTLRAMQPDERRTVSAQWFDTLPSQATVDIRPSVDISDEENYMNG